MAGDERPKFGSETQFHGIVSLADEANDGGYVPQEKPTGGSLTPREVWGTASDWRGATDGDTER